MTFQASRISRSATITVNAPLEDAFALFGPIREKDWADGWDLQVIDQPSELVQERMVFTTQSHFGLEEPDDVWIVSTYSLGDTFIEYTVFAPDRLWWIEIVCDPQGGNESTKATITYTYLGLTERGNALNEQALERMFTDDLRDWEEAVNHYLSTGERKHVH